MKKNNSHLFVYYIIQFVINVQLKTNNDESENAVQF